MSINETGEFLAKHWPLLTAIILALTPFIWGLASLYYSGRIEDLREQNNLLREQRDFFERKLKNIEEIKQQSSTNIENSSDKNKRIESLRFPRVANPQKLSKNDIRNLADFYELTKSWKTNPHLKMKNGDISYWYEQGLSEKEIELEFESRRIVLERAEKNNQVIDTQGDLSHLAQKIQAEIIKRKADKE